MVKSLLILQAIWRSVYNNLRKSLQKNESLLHLLKEFGQAQLSVKFLQQLQSQESELLELTSLFNHIRHCDEREVVVCPRN